MQGGDIIINHNIKLLMPQKNTKLNQDLNIMSSHHAKVTFKHWNRQFEHCAKHNPGKENSESCNDIITFKLPWTSISRWNLSTKHGASILHAQSS